MTQAAGIDAAGDERQVHDRTIERAQVGEFLGLQVESVTEVASGLDESVDQSRADAPTACGQV